MHQSEYRWHDLRGDSPELPEDGRNLVVWVSPKVGSPYTMTASAYWIRNFRNTCGYNVVAWKYVEPFRG